MAGHLLYPHNAIVHRMNLELPPGRREVVTLHDVIAWKYADESPPVKAAIAEIRRAAAVICVSHYTAQEAVSFWASRTQPWCPMVWATNSSTHILWRIQC